MNVYLMLLAVQIGLYASAIHLQSWADDRLRDSGSVVPVRPGNAEGMEGLRGNPVSVS